MTKSLIKIRAKKFVISIIPLCKNLKKQNEYVISKQLLRSSLSIGANISEATVAESRKDFVHKMSIAYKEAEETKYWLEILTEADYLIKKEILQNHLEEIIIILKILNKITYTIKKEFQISK